MCMIVDVPGQGYHTALLHELSHNNQDHSVMSALTDLFGPSLSTASGTVDVDTVLSGLDAVGVYFSAHWCGPCRMFTPKLAELYNAYKAKGLKFEIVFVSSDRSEPDFQAYFQEQPWLALPYASRDIKAKLSKKYKVAGIPSLIILDGAGGLITKDGRTAVSNDPEGVSFPWRPPTLWEALGDEVLTQSGDTVSVSDLRGAGKVLGLYFSANWCPPCHAFTPKLVETFKSVKAAGKQFEIIFISSDRSMADFTKYFGTMEGFHAIPQGDKRKEQLSSLFEVEGIPTLVTIDAESGAVINSDARGAVSSDPQGVAFPWTPPAVADLASPDRINEELSLCVLMDGCTKDVQDAAMAVLTPIAEAYKSEGKELIFFASTSAEGAVPQIRKLSNLETASDKPQLLLLDIPDNGGYYVAEPEVLTAHAVEEFFSAYNKGILERKQLRN